MHCALEASPSFSHVFFNLAFYDTSLSLFLSVLFLMCVHERHVHHTSFPFLSFGILFLFSLLTQQKKSAEIENRYFKKWKSIFCSDPRDHPQRLFRFDAYFGTFNASSVLKIPTDTRASSRIFHTAIYTILLLSHCEDIGNARPCLTYLAYSL